MKAARISEEMEVLSGRIQENIAMESALEMTNWAGRFGKWADVLEPKSDGEGSGGGKSGSAGGQKPVDMTQQLVALLRLKQQQRMIREQTSLLQAHRDADYTMSALKLGQRETELKSELGRIQGEVQQETFDPAFVEASKAMEEVESLLGKPQTDKVTDGAEGKVLDLMSDLVNLINEQAKRSQPNPGKEGETQESQAEEMAFLTQMMKETEEKQGSPSRAMQPGGSRSSGGHGSDVAPVSGDVRGKASGARTVGKAMGLPEGGTPPEFREALESYYHAIEKKNP
jgi:hypothetical protein